MNGLKKGDTIKCRDADDAVSTMQELDKAGIITDFCYELNGVKGIYLEVIRVRKAREK
jgi:hypothetical protein